MSSMSLNFEQRIETARLFAVLVIRNPQHAKPLIATLIENGITTVEVAWRTEGFLPMLQEIRRDFPELHLGVGTILSKDQVKAAADAGADFGLSPGVSRTVIEETGRRKWPFIPGIMTPSDIQLALEFGYRLMKFFPAETSNGVRHLKMISAPFLHLNPQYVVLGGVEPANAGNYISDPLVSAIGGSWIAPPERIEAQDWKSIADRTRHAVTLLAR